MLVLTRRPGESILIGDDIKITVVKIKGRMARIGIDAPRHVAIHRQEIYAAIQDKAQEGNPCPQQP